MSELAERFVRAFPAGPVDRDTVAAWLRLDAAVRATAGLDQSNIHTNRPSDPSDGRDDAQTF